MSKLVRNTIPFKVTRTSQPQFATGIDWSNPITRGLVLCVDSATGYRDLFSPSGVNSGVSSRATQKGISGYFGGAQRYSLGRKAFTNLYYGSVVFDIRIDVFDSAHVFYEAGTGFNNIAVKIPANTSSALKFNVGSNTDRSSAKTSWTSGQWYNIAIVWDAFAPTVKLYINGVIDSTFAVTSFTNAASFNTSIGSYDIGTFGSYFTGSMSGITGFKRALTDPEIKSLSENPWQIFQPIVRQIPYDMLRGAWQRRESYLLGTTPPTLSASMPAMVGKRVWTSQPQVPVQLDWSNPITRGLFVCIEPSQTFLNGRRNGVLSTGSTLPPLSATKNGLGRKTTGGTYDLRIQADGPTLSTDSWTIAVRLVHSANATL